MKIVDLQVTILEQVSENAVLLSLSKLDLENGERKTNQNQPTRLEQRRRQKGGLIIMQEKGELRYMNSSLSYSVLRTRVKDINKAFKALERLCRTHFHSDRTQSKVCTLLI